MKDLKKKQPATASRTDIRVVFIAPETLMFVHLNQNSNLDGLCNYVSSWQNSTYHIDQKRKVKHKLKNLHMPKHFGNDHMAPNSPNLGTHSIPSVRNTDDR